jgi:hypothetical protein
MQETRVTRVTRGIRVARVRSMKGVLQKKVVVAKVCDVIEH